MISVSEYAPGKSEWSLIYKWIPIKQRVYRHGRDDYSSGEAASYNLQCQRSYYQWQPEHISGWFGSCGSCETSMEAAPSATASSQAVEAKY